MSNAIYHGAPHERSNRGFTLIELLVVIAIIALLAAILFPVFARARENARRATCQSNMKQIGIGFLQYAQDYDEHLPVGPASNGYYYGIGWMGAIYPYVKSTQLFQCPSDTGASGGPNSSPGYWTMSYGYNINIANNIKFDDPTHYRNVSGAIVKLQAPAATVMSFEVTYCYTYFPVAADGGAEETWNSGSYSSCSGNGIYDLYNRTGGYGIDDAVAYATGNIGARFTASNLPAAADGVTTSVYTGVDGRHLTGSNYLLCDGHVKFFMPTKVSSGATALTSADAQQGGSMSTTINAAGTANNTWSATFSTT